METEQGKLPPPPGLIASLAAGFDSVATHILVILPPVVFDLLLWLGPHLRLKGFLQPLIDRFIPYVAKNLPSSFPDITTVQKSWTTIADNFNLLAFLRTFPIGVTSLLSFQLTGNTPLGGAASVDAGSFFGVAGWVMLLIVLGWLSGSLYYYWVSVVALSPGARSLWGSVKQSVMLSLIWVAALILFGTPIFLLLSVLLVIPVVGQIILFIVGMALIWMVMPIFFSAHGIFALQLDAMRAILTSLRLVRFTLPNTGLFLLVFLLLNEGMNFLWRTPQQASWWMLVGIIGHAFVSTALLAASFVYYRDINSWLTVVFEQLRRQTTSAKA
jgi:hypothetical protein